MKMSLATLGNVAKPFTKQYRLKYWVNRFVCSCVGVYYT